MSVSTHGLVVADSVSRRAVTNDGSRLFTGARVQPKVIECAVRVPMVKRPVVEGPQRLAVASDSSHFSRGFILAMPSPSPAWNLDVVGSPVIPVTAHCVVRRRTGAGCGDRIPSSPPWVLNLELDRLFGVQGESVRHKRLVAKGDAIFVRGVHHASG